MSDPFFIIDAIVVTASWRLFKFGSRLQLNDVGTVMMKISACLRISGSIVG
jgi:hypothetical protein